MTWSSLQADSVTEDHLSAKCCINVSFSNIAWPFLQSVYGWSVCQYQAWARGKLRVEAETEQTVVLYTDRVLELWVNDKMYFGGDLYALRNARKFCRSTVFVFPNMFAVHSSRTCS